MSTKGAGDTTLDFMLEFHDMEVDRESNLTPNQLLDPTAHGIPFFVSFVLFVVSALHNLASNKPNLEGTIHSQ